MQAWEDLGSPTYPTPEESAKMQAASAKVDAEMLTVTRVSDTESTVSFAMEGNSVVFLSL